MIKIALHGAEFFAWHGLYPEEQKLGSRFIVDVETAFEPNKNLSEDELAHTIDYEQLYGIVNKQMKQTRKLIETVAQAILDEIRSAYNEIESIEVRIKKMNPPLGCKINYSSVTVNYNKHNGLQ